MTVIMKPGVEAQLQVEKIETRVGYTIIQDKITLIPMTYNYTLHIIDLVYIDKIIKQLIISSSHLPRDENKTLLKDLEKLLDKMTTLKFGHITLANRRKRGLINFIGTINKWLTGTMDDEDRQLVNQHFENIEKNDYDLSENLNNQIKINNNFNTSINTLLYTIKDDRKLIEEFIKNKNNQTNIKLITFDLRLRIQELDKIINDLQDNIIFSNLNIIHPSLLTHQEIIDYKINVNILKLIKVGFTKTTTNKLLFLIKIPFEMININEKLIMPLANTENCYELNNPSIRVFEYNNKYFEFNQDKSLKQLNKLNHCIINSNCENIKNCNTEINHIDDSSMIIQLANNLSLTSYFDNRIFILNGNYFIKYFNGSITLNNETFSNEIKEIRNKYILPNLEYKSINNTISFKELNIETQNNINEINLLKYHRNVMYSTTIFVLILIMLIIIFGIILYCKFIRVIFLKKNLKETQENFSLKEGGVIFPSNTTYKIDPIKTPTAHKVILF